MKAKTLISRSSTAFHESFALNKPSLAKILEIAVESGGRVTYDALKEGTSLGNNYVKAMPRYAKCCGLLETGQGSDRGITPFGMAVYENDPNLMHPATLWLMHYHLSAPTGPGPLFWHYCIKEKLRAGAEIESSSLSGNLGAFLSHSEGTNLESKTIKQAISVLLGSYTKEDGLGKLGILEEIKRGEYRVIEPEPAPVFAIGYALAHYWENVYFEAGQVDLESFFSAGGFADLMYLSDFDLKTAMRTLQREQILELWRVAPPYQVVKRWNSPLDFLERLYE